MTYAQIGERPYYDQTDRERFCGDWIDKVAEARTKLETLRDEIQEIIDENEADDEEWYLEDESDWCYSMLADVENAIDCIE